MKKFLLPVLVAAVLVPSQTVAAPSTFGQRVSVLETKVAELATVIGDVTAEEVQALIKLVRVNVPSNNDGKTVSPSRVSAVISFFKTKKGMLSVGGAAMIAYILYNSDFLNSSEDEEAVKKEAVA
jgi:hypothetical protein